MLATWRLLILVVLCVGLEACTSPVRAVRIDRADALRELQRSAVTTGEPSLETRAVLLERDLLEAFDEQPEAAVAELHRAMVASGADPNLLFALAELSYLVGEASASPEHKLASLVYAWAFLFPGMEAGARSDPLDPRLRTAADLYNWALTSALASGDGEQVELRGGTFALPFGRIEVAFDAAQLRVGDRELYGFLPVAELAVEGLTVRYRRPGIGAPLAASTRVVEGAEGSADLLAPRLRVPATALVRIPEARRALLSGEPLAATLELHLAWDEENVTIDDETVPLENEPSAALALTFTGIPIVQIELLGFMGRLTGLLADRPPLVSTTPYRPGLIPVVFVHGTASSIVRWADLYNRLHAVPEIRQNYQFWFFQYDSDNPIARSSLQLRESLADALSRLDPEGRDEALRRMILIGHSQGGLLVKMQAIDTGDRLWNAVSRKPLEELRLADQTRSLLQRAMFVEPVPEITRVVFIATPHRGSFLAASNFVQNLMRRITILPTHLNTMSLDVMRNLDAMKSPFIPTAVDNMSPHHPFIQGLQQIDVVPSIEVHSIIAVDGDGPPEEGNDGVVEYTSAHLDGVASERVVNSPHSCQGNPHTMAEVLRILRLHARLDHAVASSDAP